MITVVFCRCHVFTVVLAIVNLVPAILLVLSCVRLLLSSSHVYCEPAILHVQRVQYRMQV